MLQSQLIQTHQLIIVHYVIMPAGQSRQRSEFQQ